SALGAAVCALMVPAAHAQATTQTFAYTGAEQTFTVPAGVSSVHVAAVGGSGGNTDRPGGVAAQVSGDLSVTPGETLYVEVGARGGESAGYSSGAFNGGGEGAGGGGGASDVRTSPLASGLLPDPRLLVAGGGGGAGMSGTAIGGAGGAAGEAGEQSSAGNGGGGPGAQSSGGAGGTGISCHACSAGQLGVGGNAPDSGDIGGGGGGG